MRKKNFRAENFLVENFFSVKYYFFTIFYLVSFFLQKNNFWQKFILKKKIRQNFFCLQIVFCNFFWQIIFFKKIWQNLFWQFFLTKFLQMSLWLLEFVQDGPRNLPLKLGQNRVSNTWYIPDMDKCHKDKFCLDKCRHDSWNQFKIVPGIFF